MSLYALPGLFPPLEAPMTRVTAVCRLPDGSSVGSDSTRESEALHVRRESSSTHDFDLERSEATVVIREARLDPARLIQSLTKKDASNSKGGPAATGKRRPRTAPVPSDLSLSPQEEAMEFVVTVENGGRSYTATRSLESFFWLRHGLLQERLDCSSPAGGRAIPDLPRVRQGDFVVGGWGTAGGGTGQGFAFLQAQLRSYAPALEEWLRSLLRIASRPDASAAWWHFFQGEDPAVAARHHSSVSPSQSSASFRKLDSIEESESEHEG